MIAANLTFLTSEFPEDLLSSVYTHLNYAFAFVDPTSFAVAPMAELDKSLYPRFTGLKELNPGLQTWASDRLESFRYIDGFKANKLR